MAERHKVTIVRGDYTLAPGPEWTGAAAAWPVLIVERITDPAQLGPDGLMLADEFGPRPAGSAVPQLHLVCARCEGRPSVLCLSPDTRGPGYTLTPADIQGATLAHLRRSHPDVVTS